MTFCLASTSRSGYVKIAPVQTAGLEMEFPSRQTPVYLTSRASVVASVAFLVLGALLPGSFGTSSERMTQTAQVSVQTGEPGCTVELDAAPQGKTDGYGHLVLEEVEATDHYIHVRCPDDPRETSYFVSLRPGENALIRHGTAAAATSNAGATAAPAAQLEPAEAAIRLRELVKDAVQWRGRGHLQEAVEELREATRLDPENADLHRELGITFLLDKDWKRARAEMLEAIRHDPSNADAHNGLGYALEKLGQIEPALREYRAAAHLEPDDTSYRQHYLEALARLAAQKAEKKK